MSRFLTHVKRLREPQEPVERFLTHVAPLGSKLGPVLLQFPPTYKIDLAALEETAALFPDDKRVVLEFRHDGWFVDETREWTGFEVTRMPGPRDVTIDLEGTEGWSTPEYREKLKT